MAIRDNLTGIYNRQYFQKVMQSLDPKQESFALIMADINNLKHINDNVGHLAGDIIIKAAAKVLEKSIRRTDRLFRYGGDEFVIIMPGCSEEDVKKVLQRIKNNMVAWKAPKPGLKLTLSVGYAMSSAGKSINEILTLADKNMYIQKKMYNWSLTSQNEKPLQFNGL